MANTNQAPGQDHDRVATLSIAKDGSFDQNNPELIGDKEATLAFTKEQFAQRAVNAADPALRAELGLAGTVETGSSPDAAIDQLKAEHDKIAEAAEKQAEAVVNALSGDNEPAPAKPAKPAKADS